MDARRLAIAFLVVLVCVAGTGEARADVLTTADAKRAAAAFQAADTGQWKKAHGLAARISDPLAGSILLDRIDRERLRRPFCRKRLIPLAPVGSTGGGLDATRAAARPG